ncbi:PEPxxWA-CTERM sorting domain-containing protein [Phenylobacterium sp.]|uniref:PEPxxWA-CTERM sorting domain-containing protein n=1 Tax=Phenylobacterium sp. TaxID=1871053 RepID=UPI00122A716D|nr:PEPxxWA-CTERM sorting domain-containing protein [Phenylobacterium sp.]THD57889.1 MAG: PEP-CTERM sorting domain-containing protein [Phenylobacterium sp.]
MKINLFAAAAVASFACATAASATEVINVSAVVGDSTPAGSLMITQFNTDSHGNLIIAPGYSFTQGSANSYITNYPGSSNSAPPPNDTTPYETVQGGSTATLADLHGALTSFSFYMGSPDTYNGVVFTIVGVNGTTQTLSGEQIWCSAAQISASTCPNSGDGNQGVGYTVTYTFAPDAVKAIEFTSSSNSFEFDNLSGVSVPEPASWALMIMGFGAAGAMVRSRRKAVAA